ncbi:unnamed protein product [Adineta ricciae]|uniref:Uncharacterized protein n=1 Tax=Adineta ricciae TaxID=249248 RepID=A0A813VEW0_ADIRI|nr:unnamed protein product [Adineta ricciae]
MLQKDQRIDDSSSKFPTKLTESNSFHSSSLQTTTVNRRIPTMLTKHENQHVEYDRYETTIKSTRATKRYIELVYHLQSFYERLTDQLSNGNCFFKTNQSLFANHCRKITEQIEKCKPIWEAKLAELQKQLIQLSTESNQITFLKRRLTLINLLQILNKGTELDATDQSIRTDIDRVLYEDKLAVQLQDELSTLLQHQSLLHEFTSLLQWNCLIYSLNEQNRVESILPVLREQTTTTDNYITLVSKQLTELVANIRSSEKYILSYTNIIPSIDDGMLSRQLSSSKDESWRLNNKNDVPPTKTREYRLQQARQNENTNDHSPRIRSTSVPRYKTAGDSIHKLDRDDLRISINTNNSNNNVIPTRYAAVKSAKREVNTQSNVKGILKSYSQPHSSNSKRAEHDVNREKTERDDERKFFSKPLNPLDDDLRSSYDLKGYSRSRQKAYNLQSMLADDKQPTNRYFSDL